ncbi:glycoside hydrolase [Pseudomonas sp. GM17]|uniref:glycoside hydrolase n=1 Tax=Pseudomonas sp. GM17 TaxID=1144323 RepID=UPI0002723EB7|nr:glycoside hydrolase [Pseudomonas sp. GM17]WIE52808.1 glycoside hydrolase [Pseudomonas sp. GM17]
MAFGITATVTVAEMVAADLGFVFIDGGESAAVTAGKISFGIVKSEGTDAAKTWGIGPAMEGLELANAITDAPSAVNYNNVSYVFTQSGGILQYSTCSGSGWSASTTLVQSGLCLTDTPEPTRFTPEFGPSAVVFNDLLYVFYQGTPLGSTTTGLYYSVFNGTTWSDAIQVDNVGISCSPCAVVFNYQLYVFHQGGGNNGQLCYSVFNGASWAADKQVAGVGMSVSPAAAVYNGELYVLYQGSGNDGQLWYSTYNGNWSSSNNTDSSGGISAEPCAIVYDGELLVLHQGSGNSRNIYVNAFNGSSWVGDTQMAPIRISNSPAPVIFNDELYCFWQGPGSNGQLQYSGSDSSNWMPTTTLSGAQMSCSPSATEFNNQLYCMYQGSWQSGYLYQSVGTVQSTWSSPSTASPISLSASPSVVAVSDTLLYSFFQQEGQLCYTTCTSTNAWTSPYLVGWSSSATQLNTIGLMYTPSTVMFTPSGATSAQLYIFYQTADNTVSGQLWYVIFDTATGTCSPPIQVANVSLSYSPSAVVFNKQLYVFYQGGAGGQGNSGLYYDCLSTAGAWSGSQQVPGVGIAYSPAPVVYNNQLYVFHQGEGGGQPDNDLFYDCLSSAGTWSGDTQVSWVNLSYSPSAVFCGNQILVCYQGEANGQPDGCTYIASLTSSGGTSLEGYVDIVPATPPVMNGPGTAAAPITYAPAVAVCNDNLYILHQGGGASGQLWFNVMNSTSWSGATQVNPQVLSASPCAVNFGNVIYSFYNQGGQLWCNGNAGGAATWLPETQIPGVMLSGTPSAVVFNNEIYVFYQGASNNGQLCYVTYNPSTSSWASPVWINSAGEVLMENSPSAVVFNNVLYVFYQGVGVSWCYNTCSDGSTWGGQVQPSIGGGEASPSAVVYNDQLYLFYQGGDDWGVYYNIFDGSSWTPDAPIPDYPVISASPSAAVYAGELYVFYQTSANSGGLDYSVLNGSTWSSTLEVMPTGSMSGSPAAVLLNNYALWVLYEGPGNNGELCYVAYNGQLSWSTQHQVVPAVSSTYYSGQNAILSWCPNLLVSDNLLYVFMPASKEADVPYYLWSADGSSWSTLYKVPGTGIWDSPSAVVFNNTIYLFHTGTSGTSSGTDSQLWCNSAPCNPAGPLTWSGDKQLVNGATGQAMGLMANQSPSAVVFNNNIYCFFASPNNTLSYVIFNGSSYSPGINYIIPSSGSNEIASSSPAAIVYNNQLYVFFQGVGRNSQPDGQLLYVTSSNGSSWSGVQQAGYLQAATGLSVWNILSTQVQSLIPPVMTNLKGQGPVDDKDIFGPNLFPAP